MKKICFPSYIQYLLIILASVIHIFIAMSIPSGLFSRDLESIFIFSFLFWGFLSFFNKCPKCEKVVTLTKNGLSSPIRGTICDQCGQDLMKCEIESDEITKKRLS